MSRRIRKEISFARRLFTALTDARADQILDHPSPDVTGRLAKPAFDATLSTKDGKKLTVAEFRKRQATLYMRGAARGRRSTS